MWREGVRRWQAYGEGVFAIQKVSSLYSLRTGRISALLLILLVFWGCRYTDGLSVTLAPEGKVALKRLVILPFEDIIPKEEAATIVSCPLCGAVFHGDKNSMSEGAALEDIFLERLQEYKQFTVLPPESSEEVYRRLSATGKAPLTDILKLTGGELGADGVLIGYVYRYRDRKGYSYSVEKPASVAFDVHLVRVADGLIVWRGVFDKTQSSLMENLFQLSSFYRYGIKWVTAHELAEEGVAEILKTFPGIN
jgi:hypothetical protein